MIYVRISQDRESAEKRVRAQEVDCRAVAQALGWDVVSVVPDNDTGASSKSRKPRPGFAEVRRLVEGREVDAVIAYSTSRPTRCPAELEEVIGWHDRHGIPLATVAGQLDLGTGNVVMLARVLDAVDANEADTISERVKPRALDNAMDGHANGGVVERSGSSETA
jgi:DNA invertase Pin-like site-specific DNA recombinase